MRKSNVLDLDPAPLTVSPAPGGYVLGDHQVSPRSARCSRRYSRRPTAAMREYRATMEPRIPGWTLAKHAHRVP